MPLYAFEGRAPSVHPDAWIAPTATLIGDVTVEARASVWYGAVLRGDLGAIVVREGSNVQDGTVVHGGADPVTTIGPEATIGHLCIVHGCTVGRQALVGNGAVVQDNAVVGDRSLVAAGSTVTPGTVIPPETVVTGTPAKVRGPLEGTAKFWVDHNAPVYEELAARHAAGVAEV